MTPQGERAISEIRVGERHRKDLGDLDAMAASIRSVGLLHPLVITEDGSLVAGRRRLEAVRKLGRPTVPVRVVAGLDGALQLLRAERDENTCRKDFTPSEAVAIGKALEALERPKAKERQAQAGPAEGKGKKASGSGKLPEAVAGQTRDKVAEAVGMSGRNYEKAKAVIEAAEADPSLAPVVEEMDRTGKVDPAYQKVPKKKATQGKRPRPKRRSNTFHSLDPQGKEILDKHRLTYSDAQMMELRLVTNNAVRHRLAALVAMDKATSVAKAKDLLLYQLADETGLDNLYKAVSPLLEELDQWGKAHEFQMSPVAIRRIAVALRRAIADFRKLPPEGIPEIPDKPSDVATHAQAGDDAVA
jgi:ParB family chromosome partitioning protein